MRRVHAQLKSREVVPARARVLHEPDFVAEDVGVRETLALVAAAVRVNAPILIQGETGSGKEMLARYAHEVSGRKGELVAINCAAMPENLFEAELFGYAAGAFTGARKDGTEGLIVSADGGTLLLDEIGALVPQLQATLLRFLDDRLVRSVGGRGGRVVDVQILAATNSRSRGRSRCQAFSCGSSLPARHHQGRASAAQGPQRLRGGAALHARAHRPGCDHFRSGGRAPGVA